MSDEFQINLASGQTCFFNDTKLFCGTVNFLRQKQMISHYFLKIKNKNIQLMFKNAQLIMSFMMIKVKYKGMFHRNVSSFILNFFRVNLFDCQVCSWKVCYSTCRQQPEVTTLSCPINSKSAGETELPLHPFL